MATLREQLAARRQQAQTGQELGMPTSAVAGAQAEAENLNFLQRALIGAGREASDLIEGGRQLLGLSSPERQRQVQAAQETFEAGLGGDVAATVGRVAGGLGATMAPGGLAARAAQVAAPRLATAVGAAAARSPILAGAAVGGAEGGLRFVGEEDSRLQNVGLGALGGGGATAALRGTGRLVNALRGQRAPGRGREIAELGERFGVTTTGADVTESQAIRQADVLAENIPVVGGLRTRRLQTEQAGAAAERLRQAQNVDADPSLTTGEMIQQGIGRGLRNARGQATERYNRVRELALESDSIVNPSKAQQQLTEIIEDPGFATTLDARTVNRLQQIGNDIENQSFANALQTRSQLQGEVDRLYESGQRAEGRALNSVLRAFREDMDDAATRAGGELGSAYREANRFFKTEVADKYYKTLIQNASRSETPDVLYNRFMQSTSKVSRPRMLYNALDEQGRAEVRAGFIGDAIERATVANPNGEEIFSPARFAQVMERSQGQMKEFFGPEGVEELQGFTRLMRGIQRAGQVGENPPTGNRLTGLALAGAGGLFAPFATLGPLAAFRALTRTQAGRELLLSSGRLADNSPRLQRNLESAAALLGSQAATE